MEPSRVKLSKDSDNKETVERAGMVEEFEQRNAVLHHRVSLEGDGIRKSEKFDSRESLAWDNAFFTSEGILEHDELCSMQNLRGIFEQKKQVLEPLESSNRPEIGRSGRYNLRNSLAWDNAFFTSAGVLEPEELASILYEEVQSRKVVEKREQKLQSFELPKLDDKGGSGRYNLRQSLAWDNAFFTSAGVLEPEELSCIIKGVEKDGIALLPQIEEEVYRSTESISTLGDDSLESLEADLFEDFRASTQRSNEVQNTVNSDGKTGSEVTKCQDKHDIKLDATSGNKMKPGIMSRMGTGRTRIMGKSTKQSVITPGDILSLSKVPNTDRIDSAKTLPSKGAPLSADNSRKEKNGTKKLGVSSSRIANVGAPVLKKSASVGSCGSLPRHAVSRKSSSKALSSENIDTESPSSSLDSSKSTLSDNIGDSRLKLMRRKIGPRASNSPSSARIFKTPSKIISKNKFQSANLQLSANLKPVTNLSPNLSHASSIGEWSSESSSSSVGINQRSTRLRSLNCKRSSISSNNSQILNSQNRANGRYFTENVTQMGLSVLPVEITLAETQTPNHAASVKSSGLRRLSTKIGYSKVKSGRIRKGKEQSHSTISDNSSKIEAGSSSPGSSMSKLGQLRSARSSSSVSSKKSIVQLDATDAESKSPMIDEFSKSTMKVSQVSKSVDFISLKNQEKSSLRSCKESQLMAEEVGDGRFDIDKHIPELCFDKNAGGLGCLSNKTNLERKGSFRSHINGGQSTTVEITIPTNKNRSGLLDNLDDKAHMGDQVNILCRKIIDMDIKEAVDDNFSFSR